VLLSEATLVFLLLLPLTLALGASFPLAVAAADTRLESAARPASRLFTSNTVGAIAGAIVGGFVLLPAIGLRGTLLAAAGLGLAVAAGLAAPQPSWRMGRAALVVTAAAAGAAAWWLPRWNPSLLAAGLYRQAPEPGFDAEIEVGAGTLLYYDDGPTGTVSVRRVAGEIALAINGKVDASNAGDMLTQKLLAHLPLLLHPAPLDVAIIGLGSGVTAGAALAHPVTSVDSIELSPQVVRASRFFDADSHRPLDDPRSRLIVGDGRTHLRYSRRQYDVIISEPSNPWMAGVAPLFTREVFVSARDRLRPDGIFCQWAHTYQMSRDDLASIVATFLAAFPDGSLWLVGDADVLLIGTRDGRSGERIQSLSARWRATPDARGDLERVEVRDVESLLALHVAGGRGLAAFARGARVQTDDATALEFSAPLALYERPGLALIARLRALAPEWPHPPIVATARASTDALVWRNRAAMYLAAEAYGPALDSASRALELDPDSEAVDILVKAAAPLGRSDDVTARLIGLTRQHPDAIRPRLALSRLLATRGDLEGAVQTVGAALEHHHESAAAWAQLASVLADLGDAERLTQAVAEIERRAPGSWEALYYAATAAFLTGDLSRAVELGDRASSLSRDGDGRAFNLVGAAQATAGNGEAARRAFEASLGRDPRDPATYVNLARLELESGNPRRASALFSEALVLDPLSSHARQGLAAVRLGSR
jgi:spermidine synthase